MKRILSLVLSLLILISSLSFSLTAFADNSEGSAENMFYTGKRTASFQPLMATAYADEPDYYIYSGKKYYTENDALYKIIRNALGAREKSVKIRMFSEGRIYNYQNLVERLFQEATEDRLSVSSTDGDYARWSVGSYGWSFSNERDANGFYYDATLKFSYYSTDEQEKKADARIKSIVNSVRKKNFSDYEAVKYIHDLICDSTTYDYNAVENYSDDSYDYAFTAYGALIKGKSVCQGYSSAFYRICKELGYNVRFVSSNPREGCHAWNLIQLDDKFYFVDATWDDEIRDDEEISGGFDDDSYYFFLVDYDILKSFDNHGEHTLYNALYNDDYYNEKYKANTSTEPYDFETATGLSTCKISLSNVTYAYNGKSQIPEVKILDKDLNEISDYNLTYSNSVNCGRVKITIKGKNDYSNNVTYRTYNIIPAKMTNLSYVSDSRTNSSLSIKWKKYAGGATGYDIQQYSNGGWVTTQSVGNVTSAKLKKLAPNSKIKLRIIAYKTINNYKHYGDYSDIYTTVTKPNNVKAPTLSTKSKAITVKWKKVNCSGYEIQYSQKNSMSNAKKISVSYKLNSKKISKLKKGKKYYVRIRAYKLYNGKKYYSAWSGKKSITVK